MGKVLSLGCGTNTVRISELGELPDFLMGSQVSGNNDKIHHTMIQSCSKALLSAYLAFLLCCHAIVLKHLLMLPEAANDPAQQSLKADVMSR